MVVNLFWERVATEDEVARTQRSGHRVRLSKYQQQLEVGEEACQEENMEEVEEV
jgi:hypothetical protein